MVNRDKDKDKDKDKDSFFHRWSKRKISDNEKSLNQSNSDIKKKKLEEIDKSDEINDKFAGLPDDEILKQLNLPDPEKMKAGDNFKNFLKKNVPEHLKKKALRKLWLTNPILANLDGMNEYDEDFTIATSALEEFATNYVVGKGFKGQFKPQTDNEDLDISEQSNALKTSSIRVNEQNTKVSYNKKPISNDEAIDNEAYNENTSLNEDVSEKKDDNSRKKDFSSEKEHIDSHEMIKSNNSSFVADNRTIRIKPKKMIFKS